MTRGFTESQRKAIETLDHSVLVSAAAGSGKTTVLINRIIGIILGGHANVDEMLVVTFTKAAAAEMRLRLAAAIRSHVKAHPEDAAKMREQLSRLYRAYISTIDSFALRVVREFFYEIDMEPEFTICDEVQAELMKREAAAELMEEGYETDDIIESGSFREFMRLYGEERSDERFTEKLIKNYDDLRTMPGYFEWAYEKADNLKISIDTLEGSVLREVILADAEEVFGNACEACRSMRGLLESVGLDGFYERKLAAQNNAVYEIYLMLQEGRTIPEIFAAIDAIPKSELRPKNDEKEALESVNEDVKEINKQLKSDIKKFAQRYMADDFDRAIDEMNASYEYTLYYIALMQEFEKRYAAKKKERRMMDFADITHSAVRILQNDAAASSMKRRFKYVFVDEYQDTNNLQEYLIGKVSSERNVFKVGDIKQSIYKFRRAEPELFERLQREYEDAANEDGELITLSENFRTNDATIRYINHVFESVMEGYDEAARLHTATVCPTEYDFKPEVHVLLKDGDNETATDGINEVNEVDDEEIEELSSSEAEASYIASLAASIIGTPFYDTKKGTVRNAEARDIAVLMRSVKYSGEQIASALAALSVESHIEETDDYFDTLEINIALALLSCIDNMRRDVPLIATLHSEVFDFSPEELATVRIEHREATEESRAPYHKAFAWYAACGQDADLKVKVTEARDRLLIWRRLSRIMPLDEFIWKVLVDSGYYRIVGAMHGGGRRQANLRALADKAASMSRENVASLSSFISFAEVMKSKKISNGQPPMAGKDDNLVRISTMHKSKGLEFPFVIVGGLGRRFNRDTNEKSFSFDSGIGVGMPYIDPERRYWRSTLLQQAMKSKSDSDDYKEDLRLLYVDMTRARNKLYLVGTAESEDSIHKYGKSGNYLRVLRDFIKTPYNEYKILPLPKTAAEDQKKHIGTSDERGVKLSSSAEALYAEIDRRFSYKYPDEELLSAKSKYSVSELRHASEDDESAVGDSDAEVVRLWKRNENEKKASATDVGIAYHRLMEFIDFGRVMVNGGNPDDAYIRERAEFLRSCDAIDADAYEAMDIRKVAHFFESEVGRRAAKASEQGTLRKEKAFTLKTVREGREILVQGVIDCCFEEDGEMVLIDYKSSFIKPGRQHRDELTRIRNEYKVQIDLYSEAVRKGTGLNVKEAYLYLFSTGEAISMRDDI